MTSTRTFEELCILASRNQWCWKIPCTTCGNQDFRLALRELAEGELSEEWWSLAKNRRKLQQRLQHLDAFRPWPLAAQTALMAKIAATRLSKIARDGRFPDWLGLLGIALFQTEKAEAKDRVLTSAWGRQLLEMLPALTTADSQLAVILRSADSVLTWRDLESVEMGLSRSEHVREAR